MRGRENRVAETANRRAVEGAMEKDDVDRRMGSLLEKRFELCRDQGRPEGSRLIECSNDRHAAGADPCKHGVVAAARTLSSGNIQVGEDLDLGAALDGRQRAARGLLHFRRDRALALFVS